MLAVLAADDFLNLAGILMTGVLIGADAEPFPASIFLKADAESTCDGLSCSSSVATTKLSVSCCRLLMTLTALESRLFRRIEAWCNSRLVSACQVKQHSLAGLHL